MVKKILIFGAGSIGNHMTYASRRLNYQVSVTDVNKKALIRMKNKIYKTRYGRWDKKIQLIDYKDIFNQKKKYDLLIIGTPPQTHKELFKKISKEFLADKILIEKPLCTYNQSFNSFVNKKNYVFCGYNHSISPSFKFFLEKIKKNKRYINFINVSWQEGFKGILNAHFWMKDEFDSYLGNLHKGGGALHEHSHGLHLSVIILKCLDSFKNIKISSTNVFKTKNNLKYDKFSNTIFRSKRIILNYTTDLLTEPANKSIILSGNNFFAKWVCGFKKGKDFVEIKTKDKLLTKFFNKSRSSEFENELIHINNINTKKNYENSHLSIKHSVDVVKMIKRILK